MKGNRVAARKDDGQFVWLNPGSSILLTSWRLLSEGVSCLTGPACLSSFPSPQCPEETEEPTAPRRRPWLCTLALGRPWEEAGGNASDRFDGTCRSQGWIYLGTYLPAIPCCCVPSRRQTLAFAVAEAVGALASNWEVNAVEPLPPVSGLFVYSMSWCGVTLPSGQQSNCKSWSVTSVIFAFRPKLTIIWDSWTRMSKMRWLSKLGFFFFYFHCIHDGNVILWWRVALSRFVFCGKVFLSGWKLIVCATQKRVNSCSCLLSLYSPYFMSLYCLLLFIFSFMLSLPRKLQAFHIAGIWKATQAS